MADENLDAELEALIKDAEDERDEIETETETEETIEETEETSDENAQNEEVETNEDEETESEADTQEQEAETEQEEEESRSENKDFTPIEVKVGNTTITIESQEELLAFAKKGAQNVKPEQIKSEADNFIEQAKFSKEDLTLLADAKAGNPAAIAKLAETYKVDVLELTEDAANEYKPQFELQQKSEVEAVAEGIMSDEAHVNDFRAAVADVPKDFAATISSDATMLKHFSDQVKSGLAQKIIPQAIKETALNGGDFFSAYVKIGRSIYNAGKEQVKEPAKRVVSERSEKLRERANGGDKNSNRPKAKVGVKEIWEMSDADFAKGDFGKLD